MWIARIKKSNAATFFLDTEILILGFIHSKSHLLPPPPAALQLNTAVQNVLRKLLKGEKTRINIFYCGVYSNSFHFCFSVINIDALCLKKCQCYIYYKGAV